MAWSLPDKGEGFANAQSIVFQEYLEVLVDAIDGRNCVLFGCAVTEAGSPTGMNLAVAKGAVLSGGTMFAVAAANVTIGTADSTSPRFDLVVVNSSGALAVRAGTAATNPKPPARTANDVVLAVVYVPAADTSIELNKVVDLRAVRTQGPLTIYKQTTTDTVNTTSAAIQVLNRTNSGVTIPDGLFTAGRVLRLRMGGNMLLNSGTPTVRWVIAFGGTTMFSDISGASTADADRLVWRLDLDIVAQGNSDQSMVAMLIAGQIAAKTAPTTGRGDAWSTANNANAVNGDAAVNADSADRLLSVQVTFSVSNAANELVVEYATLELV